MLIEADQIAGLESRSGYHFTQPELLVYAFTDYFNHYYHEKKKPLFKDYSRVTPPVLSTPEHQARLRKYHQQLKDFVQAGLIDQSCPPSDTERYLSYILNEAQLLSKLSASFCLKREIDPEYAKAQTLFVLQAIFQDFQKQNKGNDFNSWFLTHLKPFIEEAQSTNACSNTELHALLLERQNELASAQRHIGELRYHLQMIGPANQQLYLENQNLKHQLAVMIPQSPSSLLPSSPIMPIHSSAIRIDRIQQPNFIQAVLDLPHQGIDKMATLEPLRGRIPDEEDGSAYFQQYPSYILEEVRAQIDAQLKTIARKNLLPFRAEIKVDKLPKDIGPIVRIQCWAYSRELPKLDHGFYQEAVLVKTESSQSNSSRRGSKNKQEDSSRSLDGFLAIAIPKREYDDNEQEDKILDFELILPQQDFNKYLNPSKGQIELHWLHGLIPSSRMYGVCLSPPTVMFQEQFIRAQLLPWPDSSQGNLEHSVAMDKLNESQRQVVGRLARIESGLFFLQGPPGTGKTTTATSLLAQLSIISSVQRVLVCAHSNQAVRVLLANALKLMPDVPMALIGVSNNIPTGLEDVFVHKYAYHLYNPLISLKRQLDKEQKLKNIMVLTDKIHEHYLGIIAKLSNLLAAETKMPIKTETKSGVERMHGIILFHYKNSVKIMEQLDFIIRENITSSNLERAMDELLLEIEDSIQAIQAGAHYLESFLIQRAQFVFSTLISAGRDWLHKQVSSFSAVVLDEAAQALVPEALIPLRFNPRVYIQIGDPEQLPATIVSIAAQEGGFSNSMMHWLTREFKQPYEMLTLQYRMLPEICQWPSEQYYAGKLVAAPEVMQRASVLFQSKKLSPAFKYPSLFFNIRSGQEQRYGSESSASISNPQEAEAVIAMTCYLILKCGITADKIGIITFYSAQVDLLKKEIKKQLKLEKSQGLTIDTVDSFQGGEREITLISVVRTSQSVGFLTDQRRLNVAMTRAKDARWVFGFFEPLSHSNSDLPSLLHGHKNEGMVIEENTLFEHLKTK